MTRSIFERTNAMERHTCLIRDGFYAGNSCVILRQFNNEKDRLRTFTTYPQNACKSPCLLAKDGFYYIGLGDDTVICFACQKKKTAWRVEENISDTHRNLCSDCAMVTGAGYSGNIPIVAPYSSFEGILASYHVSSLKNCIQYPKHSDQLRASGKPSYQELGITTERPKRCEYSSTSARLQTFSNWPANHPVKSKDLAVAGFYFTDHANKNDGVECFYCGGALSDWKAGEDAWVEHARHFPTCAFLKLTLGPMFPETVQLMLKEKQDQALINFQVVVDRLTVDQSIEYKGSALENDPAVQAVCAFGYHKEEVLPLASSLNNNGGILSAQSLYRVAAGKHSGEVCSRGRECDPDIARMEKMNQDLRLKRLCKQCRNKEVAVVFLPCGHLVFCTECGPSMQECPVCQSLIEGKIRAFIPVQM
ncbi:hypothetical protein EGW08_004232 [Elysia chlorotica]|uniref:RING-type domain-containing protein n=1 Tax=Elysia chlorotica TaxID=188477 RepID=A0A433U297_ELYCH|nr:hypothetical protein EGW08_004232 [Elysia chlorotica]